MLFTNRNYCMQDQPPSVRVPHAAEQVQVTLNALVPGALTVALHLHCPSANDAVN